jgi:sulfur relay (sulfurtransferase) DsrC/TusE family protein
MIYNRLLKNQTFHVEQIENLSKNGIYCIHFKNRPNKFYVGSAAIKGIQNRSSKGFWSRWRIHLSKLRLNKHHSNHLQNAFNKYGVENLQFKILEIVEDLNTIVEKEQLWIDELNSYNNGYNILPFARSSIGRISKLNINGKAICLYDLNGKLLQEFNSAREANRKIGANYKLIHKCCVGNLIAEHNRIWRFKNDDFNKFSTKPKIDTTIKKVKQYKMNGEFIKEYNSISEASGLNKITLSNISMCLRQQRNSAGGFLWKI